VLDLELAYLGGEVGVALTAFGDMPSQLVNEGVEVEGLAQRPGAFAMGHLVALGGVTLQGGQRQPASLGAIEVAHPEISCQLRLQADRCLESAVTAQLVDAHRAD